MKKASADILFFVLCLCAVFSQDNSYEKTIAEPGSRLEKLEPAGFIEQSAVTGESSIIVPPGDSGFLYSGRIDFSKPATPVFIWQGSGFSCTFYGPSFGISLSSTGQNSYYNVIIDGKIYLLHPSGGSQSYYVLDADLGEGLHTCTVFKRVEAMFAQDKFYGLVLERREKVGGLGSPPPEKDLLIEFYGDSITAGACNEDPDEDSYTNYLEHNNFTSYGAITCRLLDADYSNIAVSGTGISASWNDILLSKTWKNLYPRLRSPLYDFSKRMPDIVVINLGQNDYGYPQSKGEPFPSDFAEKYEAFLHQVREVYPDAWIVCATGGMGAVKSSRALITGINNAVKNCNDEKISVYFYKAFTYNHPRLDTHEKMAYELINFLTDKGIVVQD